MSAHQDKDKPSVAHNEDSEPGQIGSDFTEEEIKRIHRRIDLRLLPALGLMYGISLMDRTNVSHAAIAGMFDDLDLNTGYGYSTITLIFFVSCIVFQPTITILCRKIGPKIFLSAACLAWGVVLIGFGFVHDRKAMVGLRVIVGVFKAGFFPGAVYLLSTWYTRCQEAEKPSPLFLQVDEAKVVLQRLDADRGVTKLEPFSLAAFLKPANEIEIWAFAFLFFVAEAQCLGSPPYIFAAIVMFTGSWAGDRYKKRALILFINCAIGITGLPIMAFHPDPKVKYFGIFIAVAGANANSPAIMSYQASNIRGQWKRAFCSALLTIFGGIGGIAGSLVFRSQDSPHYRPGMIACLVTVSALQAPE
ncbi:unnamed protein product, partial [Clonostachys chloroleuca]